MIYVTIDEKHFVEGWSTTKIEGSIPVKKEKMVDNIKEAHGLYRYEADIEEFVEDHAKALEDSKRMKLLFMNEKSVQQNLYGFKVVIGGENLRFQNTSENKSFLQKAYNIVSDERLGVEIVSMKFINENGNEVTKNINKENVYEVWMLSFFYENELNRYMSETIIPKIQRAKTLEELDKVEWNEDELQKSRSFNF